MKNLLIIGLFIFIWATCATYGIMGFVTGWIPAFIIAGIIETFIRG